MTRIATKLTTTGLGLIAVLGLSACGGSSMSPTTGPGAGPGTGPGGNPALEPNVGDATEVQAIRDSINEGLGFRENDNLFGPRNGDAVYSGQWITGLEIENQPEVNALVGEVRMLVDIGGGRNPVSGEISNLNTLQNNRAIELLTGDLDISGNIGGINRRFDSGAEFLGTVSGYFGGDTLENLQIDADVSGGWRDSIVGGDPGNVIAGRTTGTANGTPGLGLVDITNGQFRADRDSGT